MGSSRPHAWGRAPYRDHRKGTGLLPEDPPACWVEGNEDQKARLFIAWMPCFRSIWAVTSNEGKVCTLENQKGSSLTGSAASSLHLGRNWALCAHGPRAGRGDLPPPPLL